MTKERPIIMSGDSVRAILDGRKTQTRRVVKRINGYDRWLTDDAIIDTQAMMSLPGRAAFVRNEFCPYGIPGDRLWVRETWCPVDDTQLDGEKWIDYKATPRYKASHPAGWDNAPDDGEALRWKPSIFMPRWASRITLEILNVRVERVQEISEWDAEAEGISPIAPGYEGVMYSEDINGEAVCSRDPAMLYSYVWDTMNAKRGYPWADNPWVWVIEFRRAAL